jgi:hypothetical protein
MTSNYKNDTYHQTLLVPYRKEEYLRDRITITRHTIKMVDNTNNNVTKIINNINKLKNGSCKKYQISGYHEYKLLEHELKQISHIKYKLVEDKLLQRNKVNKIIGSYSDGCCFDCDGTIKYEHTKTSVLYIQINK